MSTLPPSLTRRDRVQTTRAAVPKLFTVEEVAALFGVGTKSVVRWADAGQIGVIRTPGGHRRFPEAAVRACYEAGGGVWPF